MARKRTGGSRRRRNGLWFRTFGPSPVGRCHWCERPLTFDESTFDHEPPLAEGNTKSGVIACVACNQARGVKTWKAK